MMMTMLILNHHDFYQYHFENVVMNAVVVVVDVAAAAVNDLNSDLSLNVYSYDYDTDDEDAVDDADDYLHSDDDDAAVSDYKYSSFL